MAKRHAFDPTSVDLGKLAQEVGERLGQLVLLSVVPDDEGAPTEALEVLDPDTGTALDVDGRTVAAGVKAHTPPPRPTERRAAAIAAAEAKAKRGDTAGALADVLALLRADTPAPPVIGTPAARP